MDDSAHDISGPAPVASTLVDWTDAARQRVVPAKIFYPADGTTACPVIVVSHGLGGSRQGYAYLGQHWASHGYVSVHVQHLGSDTAVWKDAASPLASMRAAAQSPENERLRREDIRFAIDCLQRLAEAGPTGAATAADDPPLHGRLDLARLGAAGHSMGAGTVLSLVGQASVGLAGLEPHPPERRIQAVVAMSTPVRRKPGQPLPFEQIFRSIQTPCFHMTGLRDESPIGLTAAADRRIPFDYIEGADQYLVIFREANHMSFSDHRRPGGLAPRDRVCQRLVSRLTLAFWNAYLRDDPEARQWLAGRGVTSVLDVLGTCEKKLISGPPHPR